VREASRKSRSPKPLTFRIGCHEKDPGGEGRAKLSERSREKVQEERKRPNDAYGTGINQTHVDETKKGGIKFSWGGSWERQPALGL